VISLETCIVVILATLYGAYSVSTFHTHLWRGSLCDDKMCRFEKMIIIEVEW
jgi:hypothetical protein